VQVHGSNCPRRRSQHEHWIMKIASVILAQPVTGRLPAKQA